VSYNPNSGLSHFGIVVIKGTPNRLDVFGVIEVIQRKSHISQKHREHPAKLADDGKKQLQDPVRLRSGEVEIYNERGKYRQSAKLTLPEIYLDRPEAYARLLAHRVLADQLKAGAGHKLYSASRRLKAMVKQRGGDPTRLFVEDFSPPTHPINRELADLEHWAPLLGSAINGYPANLYLFMRSPDEIGDRIRAVSPFTGVALLTCRDALLARRDLPAKTRVTRSVKRGTTDLARGAPADHKMPR
jgi:hypothetical protein